MGRLSTRNAKKHKSPRRSDRDGRSQCCSDRGNRFLRRIASKDIPTGYIARVDRFLRRIASGDRITARSTRNDRPHPPYSTVNAGFIWGNDRKYRPTRRTDRQNRPLLDIKNLQKDRFVMRVDPKGRFARRNALNVR